MRRLWFLLFVLVGLLAAAPFRSTDSDELERNRTLLKRWSIEQPEHYERLKRDFSAFFKMAPEKQKHLRELDKELHALDPDKRKHLWKVMVRYKAWLDKLSTEDRERVRNAVTTAERVQVIRDIRWLERLPAKKRKDLLELKKQKGEADFNDAVAKLRQEEKALRQQWMKALPPPPAYNLKPKTLKEFPLEVQTFYEKELEPRLDQKDRDALREAEGKWPALAKAIRDAANKHPTYPPLPAAKGGPITNWAQLKPEIQDALKEYKLTLTRYENKWPQFAIEVAKEFKKTGRILPPLGASRLEDFPLDTRDFIIKELQPLLHDKDAKIVEGMKDKWPEYPDRWRMLARAKGKVIPGISLPGPIEIWKAIR